MGGGGEVAQLEVRAARQGRVTASGRWTRIAGDGSRRWALRLLFELVVVFAGVYAAFAVSELRDRREADARRQQVRAALVEEVRDITGKTRRVAERLALSVPLLDSLVAAGARPSLEPVLEPLRVEAHMWEATLQSGALDLLDVTTVYRISEFYNGLNQAFEQYHQLVRLSETLLLPAYDGSAAGLYDPETARLLPRYRWYPVGMARLEELARGTAEAGEALLRELEGGE
jgi:hypothetical protein